MLTSNDQKVVNIFIEYSDIIVPKLSLTIPNDLALDTNGIDEPFLKQCANITNILVYLQYKKSIKT